MKIKQIKCDKIFLLLKNLFARFSSCLKAAAILKALFILELFLPAGPAQADLLEHQKLFEKPLDQASTLEFWSVAQRLNATSQIMAAFKQRKTIAVLSNPLRSSGDMLFVLNQGLCWQTKEPFQSTLLIKPGAVYQRSRSGQLESVLPQQHGAVIKLTEVFLAVFSGERQILEDNFLLHFKGNQANWSIGLKPRDQAVQHFLRSIVLRGAETVTRLEVLEENGDLTITDLTPQELGDKAFAQLSKNCFK